MFCATCGNQFVAGAMFCGKCGAPAPTGQATAPAAPAADAAAAASNPYATSQPGANPYAQASYMTPNPPKSFMTTWLFSFFLGGLGIDRFYIGNVGLGVGKLLTSLFGSFLFVGWIWPIIDLILLLAGKFRDSQGRELEGYEQNKKTAIWVTVGVLGGLTLIGIVIVVIALIAAAAASSYSYGY